MVPEEELYVRWDKPIDDPTDVLVLGGQRVTLLPSAPVPVCGNDNQATRCQSRDAWRHLLSHRSV